MNVNRIFLLGNLTGDPELKKLEGGKTVCNAAMAVNRRFRTENEKKEETVFIDLEFWGASAMFAAANLRKGSRVHVEGHLKQEFWNGGSKILVAVEEVLPVVSRLCDKKKEEEKKDE